MKIFVNEKLNKYNFVDHNNVVVGYDRKQLCCEEAFWLLDFTEKLDMEKMNSEQEGNLTSYSEEILSTYVFDASYFNSEELEVKVSFSLIDLHNHATFKLLSDNNPSIYLHLINLHSGMYYHGFLCEINSTPIYKGDI